MVDYLATITYPSKAAKEFGKKFLELSKIKPPDWLKIKLVYSTVDGKLKGYALYEVDDDKILKAEVEISKRMAFYFDIEGFEYKIERLLTPKEALPIIGLG
ncbi:MAG: hypothetical protein ACFFA8_01345 [Promethearchaeota archaeon]